MKYIKELRKLTGLSQEEFAKQLNISRAWLTQLESDESKKPSKDLYNIIKETVLLCLIPPLRYMLDEVVREKESCAVYDYLVEYGSEHSIDALSELRVLCTGISGQTLTKPAIMTGDLALQIYRAVNKTDKIDLVLLSSYSIDGLIERWNVEDRYLKEKSSEK